MNETLKTIAERYSCRAFKDTPLTDEQLKAIIDAALASPSAVNRQPWHIIAITDKSFIDEMEAESMKALAAANQATYERMKERGGKIFYNAPCMFMIASDGSNWAAMDCGILSQTVSLAAQSLGLGSLICAMGNMPLNGPRGEEFKKRMQFPEGYEFGIAILLGTPNTSKAPHEPNPEKVTYIS